MFPIVSCGHVEADFPWQRVMAVDFISSMVGILTQLTFMNSWGLVSWMATARLVPAGKGEHSHGVAGRASVALGDGSNVVGRDKARSTVWIDDKRCSRKHAILDWDPSGSGSLHITVMGTNPCFRCAPDGSAPKPLTKSDGTTPLCDGDVICFLALEFPYFVRVTSGETEDGDAVLCDLSSSEEGSDAMDVDSEAASRPPCHFGAKCYRQNADHNQQVRSLQRRRGHLGR